MHLNDVSIKRGAILAVYDVVLAYFPSSEDLYLWTTADSLSVGEYTALSP